MKGFYTNYLRIMTHGWRGGFFHIPTFFELEWICVGMVKASLALTTVTVAWLLMAYSGVISEDLRTIPDLMGSVCIFGGSAIIFAIASVKLFHRHVTEQQYDWCMSIRAYINMPEPSLPMNKVALARYFWGYLQLDSDDQERLYPYHDDDNW
jgi:hypothetical protein